MWMWVCECACMCAWYVMHASRRSFMSAEVDCQESKKKSWPYLTRPVKSAFDKTDLWHMTCHCHRWSSRGSRVASDTNGPQYLAWSHTCLNKLLCACFLNTCRSFVRTWHKWRQPWQTVAVNYVYVCLRPTPSEIRNYVSSGWLISRTYSCLLQKLVFIVFIIKKWET